MTKLRKDLEFDDHGVLNGGMPATSSWEPERRVIALRRQLKRLKKKRDLYRRRIKLWEDRLKKGRTQRRRAKVAEYRAKLEHVVKERKYLKPILAMAIEAYMAAAVKRAIQQDRRGPRGYDDNPDDERVGRLRRKVRREHDDFS